MTKYKCSICGHLYDLAKGEPGQGVVAGTEFADLPDDWMCPVCGAVKDKFRPVD
ncbi:rubredoxin [Methanofollis aquaemaris]|uniref:Rubredoxin n=1 Tax=Methanofollis aquaemaris TaxID=126734 RepID=A0A8A3S4L8_9EURY|nr:rubredoxin [Methanofollis aquaemaris]QSZ66576.1 rubredoxin [Methanofollis aquaemaris]